VQTSDLIKNGGTGLLTHFDGSFKKALGSVYPELSLEKFKHKPAGKPQKYPQLNIQVFIWIRII
jgi:hypothetical protein